MSLNVGKEVAALQRMARLRKASGMSIRPRVWGWTCLTQIHPS
jgi:hypothetical protein